MSNRGVRLWAVALLAGLSLAGCANQPASSSGESSVDDRVPFSDALSRQYALTDAARGQVQYYLSGPIDLCRNDSTGTYQVASGRLVSNAHGQYATVHIRAGTPGVAVGSGPGWLAISFEPNSYLYFVSAAVATSQPYSDSAPPANYYLWAPTNTSRLGIVNLGGTTYWAVGDSLKTYLLVDRRQLSDQKSRDATLPGRLLPGLAPPPQ